MESVREVHACCSGADFVGDVVAVIGNGVRKFYLRTFVAEWGNAWADRTDFGAARGDD